MGFLDKLFGKKKSSEIKNNVDSPAKDNSVRTTVNSNYNTKAKEYTIPLNLSVKSISEGNPFEFDFTSLSVMKQFYNGNSEEVKLNEPVKIKMSRAIKGSSVEINFSNISELKNKGVLQQNLSFVPHFSYQADNEGDEFASAEINNSFSAMTSGKEYITLYQVTKQKGKITFLINNLPGDQDFYFLIVMRDNV